MSAITWDAPTASVVDLASARRRRAERAAVRPTTVRAVRAAPAEPTAGAGRRASDRDMLRLTRRGRLVVWALALTLAGGVGAAAQSADAGAAAGPVALRTHVVQPGDSLWSVAGAVAGPGDDIRDVVAELEELNGLAGSGLQVGQQLLVPAG